MSKLNPIPTGPEMQSHWLSNRQAAPPELPDAWSASVLATPFGDSIAPQRQQLAVAKVESATLGSESWMRVSLYLSRDLRYFDFIFISSNDPSNFKSEWYWIDSSVSGRIDKIHGPFKTALRVPTPQFLKQNQATWGNRYPLMCTDTKPEGIDCDHWVIATPGPQADHGSWYSVLRNSGQIFRVLTMDSTNPVMLPFVGAYYMVNFASFEKGVTGKSKELLEAIKSGRAVSEPGYWNPLVTQQDVMRAFESPIASAECTLEDIQEVLPGFTAWPRPEPPFPNWSDRLYIEGWALALDLIPYRLRSCYNFTGDDQSKQQSIFIGWGQKPGAGSYFKRTDTCLNSSGTDMPYYEWNDASDWGDQEFCLPPLPGVGPPFPDWPARNNPAIMGQITGNPDFGLGKNQVLNIIASEKTGDFGALATFWVWFLENNVGMLFCEGNFMNSLSHTLQLLDYTLFQRDAPVVESDFSDPCLGLPPPSPPPGPVANVCGHFTHSRGKGKVQGLPVTAKFAW